MDTFEKALSNAEKQAMRDRQQFERAVLAARLRRSLDIQEQKKLERFPENERAAVLAFLRMQEGKKIVGGPIARIRAMAFFIQGFKIAEATYGEQTKPSKSDTTPQ